MQRINLFPDPNMANTIFKCITVQCTVDFPTVSGFRWLRATTSGSSDGYAQYELAGANLPPAGVYHIHSICYTRGSGAFFRVYAGDGNRYTILNETGIADDQTKMIDADITIPANTTQLLIRVVPPSTVGKFILIRDILIESKSTYDTAIGGASKLLHGGHDAARIGASVGRVMSDDGNEPMHEPILDHHLASRNVEEYHDRSLQDRGGVLGQRLFERHRRHYLDTILLWRHQWKPTGHLQSDRLQCRSDVNDVFRRVRQSDRHRDEHAHLHAGRISGEQDPARQHRIFHRGQHAARLTLLGVVA